MDTESQKLILKDIRTAYLVGIGGIGVSALARYFKSKDVIVFGSDRDLESETVKKLIDEGFQVFDQKCVESIPENIDLVIKTLAIPPENIEWQLAIEKQIPVLNYAEVLGVISQDFFTIAVAGTHGKTTTTAMAFEVAKNMGLDLTVIVGSFLNFNNSRTNFVSGGSDLFIVEACEYGRSFLNLSPNILIITNLEADHLDYYKDLDDLKQAFYDLAAKIPDEGKIICDTRDPNLKEIVADFSERIIDYSNLVEEIEFNHVFGRHNQKNGAAAVLAISEYMNKNSTGSEMSLEPNSKIIKAIKNFSGTWRRMEYKGILKNGATVYDDYAHHPTEIRATLNAFKSNFPDKKIAVFFGPHLHSRTKMFFDGFVESLSLADLVHIFPIFRARAEDDYGVSAEILTDSINQNKKDVAKFVPDFDSMIFEIEKLNNDWIVILLGAGEVYKTAEKLDFI